MTITTHGRSTPILMTRDSTETTDPALSPPLNHLMLTYIHVLEAYYAARRSKRSEPSATEWEYDYETRCFDLYTSLLSGLYTQDIRYAFITRDPVWREIIVPSFRDRVVHHLIGIYLKSLLENHYIYDTYAGRSRKGLHFAITRTESFFRSVTHSYQRDSWSLRLDIASFFRSISHARLISLLDFHIFPGLMNPLIEKLIGDHIENSRIHIERDISLWSYFPRGKSIFSAPPGYGLPLGDLVSQHLANFYLSPLDHYIKHTLKVRYYGRYMDDMIFFSSDRKELEDWKGKIDIFLSDSLGLVLHPGKSIVRSTALGVDFLGRRMLPYRTYIGSRLKASFTRRAIYADESHAGLMSVIGMIGHHSTYRLRERYLDYEEETI